MKFNIQLFAVPFSQSIKKQKEIKKKSQRFDSSWNSKMSKLWRNDRTS